jgi:hypothetical protein
MSCARLCECVYTQASGERLWRWCGVPVRRGGGGCRCKGWLALSASASSQGPQEQMQVPVPKLDGRRARQVGVAKCRMTDVDLTGR